MEEGPPVFPERKAPPPRLLSTFSVVPAVGQPSPALTLNRLATSPYQHALFSQEEENYPEETLEAIRDIVNPKSRGPRFYPQDDSLFTFIRPVDMGYTALVVRHIMLKPNQLDAYVALLAQPNGGRDRRFNPRKSIFGLPLINPLSRPAIAWMGLMLAMDLVYTAFLVPINVAFCTTSYGAHVADACTLTDLLGGIVYFVNVFFMFQCGVVLIGGNKKVTVYDGIDVAKFYVMSERFVFDVLAAIPFVYLVLIISSPALQANTWLHMLSLIRLVRMARMLSVSKMLSVSTASGQHQDSRFGRFFNVAFMYTCLLTYCIVVLLNLLACMLLLEAKLQYPGPTFFESVDFVTPFEEPNIYQWYFSLYWVITTSTGTGFGDVSPKNKVEQVLANVNMIFGILLFGLLVAAFGNALTRASATAHHLYAQRKKMAQADVWLDQRNLGDSSELRNEIRAYFAQVWEAKGVRSPEQVLLEELPPHLRGCALNIIVKPLIQKVHGLQNLKQHLQNLLAGCFRAVTILPGHDFCVQGFLADRLWIVEEGALLVLEYGDLSTFDMDRSRRYNRMFSRQSRYTNAEGSAAEEEARVQDERYSSNFVPLTTPCLIGESVMVAEEIPIFSQRLVTYRAVTTCKAWELRTADLFPLMRRYPQIKVTMLKHFRFRLTRHLEILRSRANPATPAHPAMGLGTSTTDKRDDLPANQFCEMSYVLANALFDTQGASLSAIAKITQKIHMIDLNEKDGGGIQKLIDELYKLAEVACVEPWLADDTPNIFDDNESVNYPLSRETSLRGKSLNRGLYTKSHGGGSGVEGGSVRGGTAGLRRGGSSPDLVEVVTSNGTDAKPAADLEPAAAKQPSVSAPAAQVHRLPATALQQYTSLQHTTGEADVANLPRASSLPGSPFVTHYPNALASELSDDVSNLAAPLRSAHSETDAGLGRAEAGGQEPSLTNWPSRKPRKTRFAPAVRPVIEGEEWSSSPALSQGGSTTDGTDTGSVEGGSPKSKSLLPKLRVSFDEPAGGNGQESLRRNSLDRQQQLPLPPLSSVSMPTALPPAALPEQQPAAPGTANTSSTVACPVCCSSLSVVSAGRTTAPPSQAPGTPPAGDAAQRTGRGGFRPRPAGSQSMRRARLNSRSSGMTYLPPPSPLGSLERASVQMGATAIDRYNSLTRHSVNLRDIED